MVLILSGLSRLTSWWSAQDQNTGEQPSELLSTLLSTVQGSLLAAESHVPFTGEKFSMKSFADINFSLHTDLAAFHKFCYIVFSLWLKPKHCLKFFLRYCLYLFVCFGCARGYTSSCGARASLWFLLLRSTASRARELSSCGSRALEHGPSCSTACGIFPDQGWNPCLLHWQADSLPLSHQGSPDVLLLCLFVIVTYSNLCDSDALVFETCFAADNVVNSCKYSKCAWERDKLSHCWA